MSHGNTTVWPMDTATIHPLPTPVASGEPTPLPTRIRLDGDRIVVERLVIADHGLAAFLAERPGDDQPALVERALRIGLVALQDAGVTINVDVVKTEFERLIRQSEQVNERAAAALEQTLRTNFADGDGRLPRTLERFLGDRGALRGMVDELFDEKKRDSAIGRIRGMLESYFDGDASKLAHLLDPTRLNSPMHQFRQEMTAGFKSLEERLVAIEAAAAARGAERARSAAKGADFEELLHAMLGDLARGAGDLLDRTGTEAGAIMKSKKGDFVLTLDARVARGCDLRVVIEAKDRPMSMRAIREELREAKENRGAAIGLVVFTAQHAPTGVAPFNLVGDDVYCVIDPDAPEPATLEAAVRLARLLALNSLAERDVDVDPAAIAAALTAIREQLELVRTLKAQLTSISTATKAVWTGLDTMRSNILLKVSRGRDGDPRRDLSARAANRVVVHSPYGCGGVRTRRLRGPGRRGRWRGLPSKGHLGRARCVAAVPSVLLRSPPQRSAHASPARRLPARHADRPDPCRSGERGRTERHTDPGPDPQHGTGALRRTDRCTDPRGHARTGPQRARGPAHTVSPARRVRPDACRGAPGRARPGRP